MHAPVIGTDAPLRSLFARNEGLLLVNASRLVGVHGTAVLLAVHGDHRPGAEVDPVTVAQGDHFSGRYLAAVDQRAIGRTWIEHGPGAAGYREQQRVQTADARVRGRAGQVYLQRLAAGCVTPTDAKLLSGEGGVTQKLTASTQSASTRRLRTIS